MDEKEGVGSVHHANEFPEQIPLISDLEKAGALKSGRRDFLKMMGFSVTAAAVAAGCEVPVRKSIPYIIKPDEIMPGVASYYASTYAEGGDYCSVLVKTREGRPIKIEGNKMSKVTNGGTSAVAQASVLDLYDTYRLRKPMVKGEESTWTKVDGEIASQLESINAGQGKIRILSSTILSPSTKQAIKDFIAKYPGTKHVTYDAMSCAGMLKANEAMFGRKVIPGYRFDAADLIVSVGADFLGSWISPVEYAGQYGKRRKVSNDSKAMNRHVQVESYLSLTGSNADRRIMVKPSEEGAALLHIYNIIAANSGGSAAATAKIDAGAKEALAKVAAELMAAKGKSLVVCGLNDVNAQLIANAINNLLGNYGSTIDLANFSNQRQGDDAEMNELVNELATIDALIILDANPLYNYPGREKFKAGLEKVGLAISLNTKNDETTAACGYACPSHHYLEAWDDAEPKNGSYSITQPTIAPLFKTRSAAESLLKWAGSNVSYYDYIRNYWNQNIFPKQSRFALFDLMWDRVVHDGVFETAPSSEAVTANAVDLAAAGTALAGGTPGEGMELVLYETVTIRDGKFADNPWLQEAPDPVSKVAWENFACVSKKTAETLGLQIALKKMSESVGTETNTVKVSVSGYEVTLPAIIQPGTPDNTIAIAVGYGREIKGRKGMSNIGQNAYPFLQIKGNTVTRNVSGAEASLVPGAYRIAQTQMHHSINDGLHERRIVKETTLEEYAANPHAGNEDREEIKHHLKTIYPEHKKLKSGLQWEMAIDLNSCIGCNACVISCNAENNIPVVGKDEVRRAREMHWLRIDRYYAGSEENPSVVFQPMLCQHCDNAPCENVCPVAATNHSSEGLNQMAYNRCIGTRYCANNCPYKVRRFNWYDYMGADSFLKDTIFDNDKDEHGMMEDLTRMVLNPDVNVRARGVMEKCSFCVQRIQDGKLRAKKEDRPLEDSDIATACQSACPTNAIAFGNINNEKTEVYKLANDERAFKVIEEIHTLPAITYLTKVRNKTKEETA